MALRLSQNRQRWDLNSMTAVHNPISSEERIPDERARDVTYRLSAKMKDSLH
jgi:hypothetical protein